MTKEALKLALEALEHEANIGNDDAYKLERDAIKEALAQRTWVGLTHEEIDKIYEAHHNQYGECESVNFGYERAIESKLKEKNELR